MARKCNGGKWKDDLRDLLYRRLFEAISESHNLSDFVMSLARNGVEFELRVASYKKAGRMYIPYVGFHEVFIACREIQSQFKTWKGWRKIDDYADEYGRAIGAEAICKKDESPVGERGFDVETFSRLMGCNVLPIGGRRTVVSFDDDRDEEDARVVA